MVNMISAEKAEKARMPTGPLDRDAFQLGGILGPTVGALFILEGGSFDVLLGMPWMEKNLGSVISRERGTCSSHDDLC